MNHLGVTLLLVTVAAVLLSFTMAQSMPGGISDNDKPATEELNTMLLPIKPEINVEVSKLSNGANEEVVAVSYRTQVVAGTNYFVKFRAGKQFFHARIFRDLGGNLKLVKVKGPMTEADTISYFQ